MTINYQQDKIVIDDVAIKFGESRKQIRDKLGAEFTEDNQMITIGNSNADCIYQRRDIFKDINLTGNFFFLNYDSNDLLQDVEVHDCDKIIVNSFSFDFETELDFIASELSKYSRVTPKGEGEYFFNDIKVSVLDKNQMGSEGTTLGYFYCAEDVSHLEP